MASPRPLNYTTKVPVHQTVTECQSILAASGAASVSIHFEDSQPSGLAFSLKTPHGPRDFTLPVNIGGAQAVIAKMIKTDPPHLSRAALDKLRSRDHAAMVAWRVIKDWLEANLALIAAEMATIDEVMLPYLHIQVDGEDKTLFEHYKAQERAALLPGGDRD